MVFVLFLPSCVSDVDLVNFSKDIMLDESLVMPLGDISVSMNDILNKYGLPENIDTINSEISYTNEFNYEVNFNKLNIRDSIESLEKSYNLLPYPFTFPPGMAIDVPPILGDLDFDLNEEGSENRIDSLVVLSSLLHVQVDVSPDLKHIAASNLRIELDFDDTDLLIASGVNPSTIPAGYMVTEKVPVGRYTVYLKGRKSIPFRILVFIKPQPFPVAISPDSYIKFKISFSSIKTRAAYGYFQINDDIQKVYDIPLKLNDYFPNSYFKLANPTLDVTARSSMGVDLKIIIDSLKAYNSSNPSKIYTSQFVNPLSGSKSKSIFETLNGPQQLDAWTSRTYPTFNIVNGEIDNFFDIYPYPDKIDYKYKIITDPTRPFNFITPESKIKVNVKLHIPFQVKGGSYFTLTDTIDNLNIGSFDDADSTVLILNIKNGLPFQANYRMTYYKSDAPNDTIRDVISTVADGTQIATLTSNFRINAPDVDQNGSILNGTIKTQTIKIGLNRKSIEELRQTKFIIFSLLLEGEKTMVNGVETTKPMHLTTKNSFDVKLGVFVKANSTIQIGSNR